MAWVKRGVLLVATCAAAACGGRVETIDDPISPVPASTPTTPTTPIPTTSATTKTSPPKTNDGAPCVVEHGTGRIQDGLCVPATCDAGYGVCRGMPSKTSKCELFVPWYADEDGDGYGAGENPKEWGCANLDEWHGGIVRNADDCDDKDANVHPKQTKFFDTISKGGTWDYDCDGKTTREIEDTNRYCLCSGAQCSIDEGWKNEVPECGATGTYVTTNGLTCEGIQTKRVQGCR